ncbi:MAG: hypothetical protein SV239_07585 [Thermodesulfobacteriota bacterium]|jgi:hypothetical protein|nr:hypothetical protein [Thermodesulfobacteriota bacterium]
MIRPLSGHLRPGRPLFKTKQVHIFIIHQAGIYHSIQSVNSIFPFCIQRLKNFQVHAPRLGTADAFVGLLQIWCELHLNRRQIVMHIHRSASLAVTALVLFSAPTTAQGAIGILSDSSDMLGKICYSFVLTLSIMQLIPPLVLLAFFIETAIRCLGPLPIQKQRLPLRGGKL